MAEDSKTTETTPSRDKRRQALAYARSVRTPESFRTPARVETARANLEIARSSRQKSVGDDTKLAYELTEAGRQGIQSGQARRRAREKQQQEQNQRAQ